jgi:hypothetical protein
MLTDSFSHGFEVFYKIYIGFLFVWGKVSNNTNNEFFGAGCPSGGQVRPALLPSACSPLLTEVRTLNNKQLF